MKPNDAPVKDFETKALVVEKPGSGFRMTDIILDRVREDVLLIEMLYSGICHTVSHSSCFQTLQPARHHSYLLYSGHRAPTRPPPTSRLSSYFRPRRRRPHPGHRLERHRHLPPCRRPVPPLFNVCGSCAQCRANHPAYCHTHPLVNHNAVRLSDRSTPARTKSGAVSTRSQYFGHSSLATIVS